MILKKKPTSMQIVAMYVFWSIIGFWILNSVLYVICIFFAALLQKIAFIDNRYSYRYIVLNTTIEVNHRVLDRYFTNNLPT